MWRANRYENIVAISVEQGYQLFLPATICDSAISDSIRLRALSVSASILDLLAPIASIGDTSPPQAPPLPPLVERCKLLAALGTLVDEPDLDWDPPPLAA